MPKECTGCKFVFVRRVGKRSYPDYQRICRRGMRNPSVGFAKNIETNPHACEHYAEKKPDPEEPGHGNELKGVRS